MRTAHVALIAGALAAAGCFDVRTRDPGPLVIDDFDDGDRVPALAGFGSWECYAFNAQAPRVECAVTPGTDNSPFALYLDFGIDDPLDVNAHEEFVFSAMLASGTPALPSDARLYVELACTTAVGKDGSRPGDFYVSASADYKNYWQQFRIDVASFGQPAWIVKKIEGGPERCRQLVDGIRFTIDAHLADGLSGQAVMTIDGISLQ